VRNGTTSAAPAIPSFALTGLFESKKFLLPFCVDQAASRSSV
jgi:hypothetical protein